MRDETKHGPDLSGNLWAGEAPRTFDKAFAEARRRGVAIFGWMGGNYHTRTAEEEADQKRSFVSPSGGPSEDKPLTGPEPQPKTSEVLGAFCPKEPTP